MTIGNGDRPDVAIWGITNPRAAVTLCRIAAACVNAGLRTILVWSDHKFNVATNRGSRTPSDYPVPGLEFRKVDIRYDYGILHYPRPLVLPLLQRDVHRALETIAPRCIVTQLDHCLAHRVWQHVARQMRIPGVVIQEGTTVVPKAMAADTPLEARRKWTWGKKSFLNRVITAAPHPLLHACAPYMFARYVCVWGDAMKRHLLNLGRDEGTIFVTGSPAFDHVRAIKPLAPSDRKTVLYVQQRMGMPFEDRRPFYEDIIRLVIGDLGCRLLFKLHPNSFSEVDRIRSLAARIGCSSPLLEIIDHGDAVDLLECASVVVLATSTTTYHAAVAGVPLIVVDYYSKEIRFDPTGLEASAVVRQPQGLRPTLTKALFDIAFRESLYAGARQMVKDHLFALDGRSSERVAAVVKQLGGQ